jgi:hypothetical protein
MSCSWTWRGFLKRKALALASVFIGLTPVETELVHSRDHPDLELSVAGNSTSKNTGVEVARWPFFRNQAAECNAIENCHPERQCESYSSGAALA